MKTLGIILSVVLLVVVMMGADFRRKDSPTPKTPSKGKKEPCYGYTIIEFGKGIDCYGDTVKLVKVNGGQQRLAE